MPTIAEALALACKHHQSGDLARAEQVYQRILQADHNNLEALHQLGVLALQRGQAGQAVGYFRQTVRIKPEVASFHSNLGLAYQALGQLGEAIACYQEALRLRHGYPEAHYNLGLALWQQGRLEEAVACYRDALRLRTDYPEAHFNLGIALGGLGRRAEAIACYREALRLRPDFAEVHNNLGNALRDQGQRDEAIACYREALRLRPGYPEAHNNLGTALWEQGRLDEAIACYGESVRLRPDQPQAHYNLGNALRSQKHLDEAARCFRQALKLRPDFAEAHFSLGRVLREQEKLEEAETSFYQALRLQPEMADAHYNLGLLFAFQGKIEEAERHLCESLRLEASPTVRLVLAMLLPVIYQSTDEVLAWRRRFADNIRELRQEGFILGVSTQTAPTPFWLVYQGLDDRDLLREVTGLYVPPPDPPRSPPPVRKTGKIKVGFLSHFFWNHTIAKLMRGLIAHLSRETFAVTALSVGSYRDIYARWIQQHADVSVEVPAHLPAARRVIAEQELDVLIYTDIGMDHVTYSLAFSRLAPVQCVAWGHGVTTGIPTLDYFLSGELLETEEGDAHYTERLVRLPNLGIYYYRPQPPASLQGRAHFGLPEGKHLYACLQSLFKFHPDFDALLGGILRRDPEGVLVLIEGKFPHRRELLRRRFAATLADVMDRIIFLPSQGYPDFLNLVALADVHLDPLYNVGGNSSYEAFALAKPIVTLPTRYLGGRLTWALYAQMDIWDCVANSAEDYVARAVRLGTDAAYRAEVQARIRAANDVLYENPAGVRGLDQFLQKAVGGKGP